MAGSSQVLEESGVEGCRSRFVALERQRLALLQELGRWPVEWLAFRPSAAAWSVPEVLDHIVRAEAGTLCEVRAGLRQPHVLDGAERPGIAALERALRSEQRFTVPAVAEAILPAPRVTLAEVSERWALGRAELQSVVEALVPADTCDGVFCHPFAGWMIVAEVLEHFSAHLYHHELQIARLRSGVRGCGWGEWR